MGKISSADVLKAVQKDDIKAFSFFLSQNKSVLKLCYGRFPLLSVCYLFKARKIVKKFEKQLDVSVYNCVDEPPQIYSAFKAVAGKNLRFYTGDCIVTPLEMLALSDGSGYLSQAYPRLEKTETVKNNIAKIYKSRDQKIILTDTKIITQKPPLSHFKKISILAAAIVAFIMAVCPVVSYMVVNSWGNGSAQNPYTIFSVQQFSLAFKGEDNYILKNDITLPNSFSGGDFLGNLDGQGKTIYVNKPEGAIIEELKGKISNVNFVFLDFSAEITEDTSYIAKTNSGTMLNINVSFTANLYKTLSDSASVAVFANLNKGEIKYCNLFADANFNCQEGGSASIALFCVLNEGKIENCTTTEGSKIVTDTADVAGIACVNLKNGEILNCVNNAAIKQTTYNASWFAVAAGIVLENYYYVFNCVNNGEITVESLGLTQDIPQEIFNSNPNLETLMAYIGGIAYYNEGTIEKCKNNADIKCYSRDFSFYAGAIVAANNYRVEKSCAYGSISVTCDNLQTIHFIAGITALNYYTIRECYTAIDFSNSQNANCGGIVAWHYNSYQVAYFNNYYVSAKSLVDSELSGVTVVGAVDELKALDIYWG